MIETHRAHYASDCSFVDVDVNPNQIKTKARRLESIHRIGQHEEVAKTIRD